MPTPKPRTTTRPRTAARPAVAPELSPFEAAVAKYKGRGQVAADGRYLLWRTDEPDVLALADENPDGPWGEVTDSTVELMIPLRVKTRMFRAIAGQLDELSAMITMIDSLGAKDTVAAIDEMDIFETAALVADWFAEVNGRIGAASLGESSSSSS